MNERIRELQIQAFAECKTFEDGKIRTDEVFERFAELIVREAAQFVSGSAEVYTQAEQDACARAAIGLKKYFGVEETPGWACPNCGTDRTKAVCPKGHTAALTGDCPMHGVAQ